MHEQIKARRRACNAGLHAALQRWIARNADTNAAHDIPVVILQRRRWDRLGSTCVLMR